MKIGFDFWIVNVLVNFWKESKNVCIYAQLSNLKMYFRVEFDRIKCREYRRMLNSRLADTLCLMQLWNAFFLSVGFRKLHHQSLTCSFDWEIRMLLFFEFWTPSKMFSEVSMNSLKSDGISTVSTDGYCADQKMNLSSGITTSLECSLTGHSSFSSSECQKVLCWSSIICNVCVLECGYCNVCCGPCQVFKLD